MKRLISWFSQPLLALTLLLGLWASPALAGPSAGPTDGLAATDLAVALNPDGTLRPGASGSFDSRRYAMTALGEIRDKAALPALEAILKDKQELEYMRGDALYAIHRIDKELGLKYGKEFATANDYLKMVADEISKK